MGFLRACFISLAAISRKLNYLLKNKFSCRKGRKPNKFLSSDFNWLTAETDQSFPTMELSNQLKQVFKFIDANGDGKISPPELTQVLLSLGQEKSSAAMEAEVMVREMDRDGDGLVDLEEFMSVMGRTSDHGISTFSAKEDDLFEAFLIFDTDKNGFITAKELQRVLISLGCPKKCTLKHCRRMIKRVDKDGDGFVNFEEFKSMMTMNAAA